MANWGSQHGKRSVQFTTPMAFLPSMSWSGVPVQAMALNQLAEYLRQPTSIPIQYGGQTLNMPLWTPAKATSYLASLYQPITAGERTSQSGWSAGIGSGSLKGTGGSAAQCSCYIFLEGHNELEASIRRFRDSHYSPDSSISKGYRRMSKWLVPLMKKHKIVKESARWLMLNPLAYIARWEEGKNKLGWLFIPFGYFWTTVWRMQGCKN